MVDKEFFKWHGIHQPVNLWLSCALIGLMIFWTVLMYVTQRAELISQGYLSATSTGLGF